MTETSPTERPIKEEGEEPTVDASMDAASDQAGDNLPQDREETPKRYLPDHKKPDAAPTFPEKLMSLMRYVEKQERGNDFCVAWCDDGKSFVINNPDEFTRKIVPMFFKSTKFSSFTRKLYRWQFRQINRGIGPDDPIIFGNEYFQRDKEELIAKMRSVTASSAGKHDPNHFNLMAGMKRPLGDYYEDGQKRMLFGFFNQQKYMMQGGFYGNMNSNGSIPLGNALRPGMNINSQAQTMTAMGAPYNMMMVPQMQGPNGQPMMMMNPMPMAPSMANNMMTPNNMTPMNPEMHQMPRPFQGPIIPNNGGNQNNGQPPNPQSTAEIVNAAIAALRHAK